MKHVLTYLALALTLAACKSSSTTGEGQATSETPSTAKPTTPSLVSTDAAPPDARQPATPAAPDTSVPIPAGPFKSCIICPKKHQYVFQIDAFRIAQSETTNGEYQACTTAGACRPVARTDNPDLPVVNVTWADADSYCRFAGGRLPTATEWSKAAFPDDPVQDQIGPMISSKYDPCMVLVIGGHHDEPCKKGIRHKAPVVVSAKDPDRDFDNRFDRAIHGDGLVYDLFGNVAEWVSDWYSLAEFAKPSTLDNPQGAKAEDSTEKTICGGSYSANVGLLGGFCRPLDPDKGYPDVGFRCVWDAAP